MLKIAMASINKDDVEDLVPNDVEEKSTSMKSETTRKTKSSSTDEPCPELLDVPPRSLMVRYKNEINAAGHKLDVIESRIILTAIAKVPMGDVDPNRMYYVTADEMISLGSNPTKVYEQLEAAAETLFSRYISVKAHDKDEEFVRKFRWIYTVEYRKGAGRIGVMFAPNLIPYITHLQQEFTQYELTDLYGLTSGYAVRLYSNLMQYQKTKIWVVDIDDFRYRLDLGEKFKLYGHLKSKVIQKSVDQINEGLMTKIRVTWEEVKENRKVVRLIFHIMSKKTFDAYHKRLSSDATVDSKVAKTSDLTTSQATLTPAQIEMYGDLLAGLNLKMCRETGHDGQRFYSFLISNGLIARNTKAGDSLNAFSQWLKKKLADPTFVQEIYDPWLKNLKFKPRRARRTVKVG